MIKGRFIAAVNALEIRGTVSKRVINIIRKILNLLLLIALISSSQIEKILNVKVLTEKLFVTNLKKVVLEENYRGH